MTRRNKLSKGEIVLHSNYEELIKKAKEARKNSYSPYSKVKIGAAVLTGDGKIFSGCNIENISYGISNCAERTAIFKAVSEGYRKINAIAIYGESKEFTKPCGACRQVMIEFNPDMDVIMKGEDGFMKVSKARRLLPENFYPKELKNETS